MAQDKTTKTCPKCGGEMVLFFPNIPFLTGWYCVNNDFTMPATEDEVNEELFYRSAFNDEE